MHAVLHCCNGFISFSALHWVKCKCARPHRLNIYPLDHDQPISRQLKAIMTHQISKWVVQVALQRASPFSSSCLLFQASCQLLIRCLSWIATPLTLVKPVAYCPGILLQWLDKLSFTGVCIILATLKNTDLTTIFGSGYIHTVLKLTSIYGS